MSTRLVKQSSTTWKPHVYQKDGVKFLLKHGAAALFLDPGLGKTSIALAAIKLLKERNVLSKVLLIAPLRVCHSVWPNEIKKWKDFENLTYAILHGPDKDEELKKDVDIYIINPEGLDWLLDVTKTKDSKGRIKVSVDVKRFKKLGFDTLVIDELTKFKHINTARYKSMKLVLNTFSRRWGLTGSPAANGLMDLFGQCYMLDEGRSLGPYITHFRNKYFDQGYDGFSWTLKPGADDQIFERIKPMSLRINADDVLDMPKLIENNIKVELPPKALKIYLELEKDMISKFEEGKVTAATAAAVSMKCRQVANGGIYVDQETEALLSLPSGKKYGAHLHDAKTDALEDLVNELQGNPLLVAYDFNHDLERLQARFGKDLPYIGGGITAKKSKQLEEAWNAGKLPILAGHPQSIAHGLNLQEVGHHICFYAMTWNYELWDQYIRRLRRQGNKSKRIYVHHLIASGTIDEVILATLKSKASGQNALFEALKSKYKAK